MAWACVVLGALGIVLAVAPLPYLFYLAPIVSAAGLGLGVIMRDPQHRKWVQAGMVLCVIGLGTSTMTYVMYWQAAKRMTQQAADPETQRMFDYTFRTNVRAVPRPQRNHNLPTAREEDE
jgi:hypothetical protein